MEDGERSTEETWRLGDALTAVSERLKSFNLPRMSVPQGMGGEYEYPSNVRTLTSPELGTLQLRLTGWYSETMRLLGKEDSELGGLKAVFEQSLGVAMQKVARSSEKRIIKESLKAMAIDGDERLTRAHQRIVEREALVRRLTAQAEIYKEQLMRLSREQSRRESEAHFGS